MLRKTTILIVSVWLVCPFSFAETVYLKSGKKVEGKIIEKTNGYISIDFHGVTLRYDNDQISYISNGAAAGAVAAKHEPAQSASTRQPYQDQVISRIPAQAGKSFLWKVASSHTTVYLLGSIHVAKKELYPLRKTIEDAFKASEVLVVEANVNDANTLLEAQILTMATSVYGEGDILERHVSSKTYGLAKKKLAENGLDINQFAMFKPWFVAMTITGLELKKLGFDPLLGIDAYFLGQAVDRKIIELESADFQIKLLSGFSEKEQELFLFSTIVDMNNLQQGLDTLFKSWASGDAVMVEKISFKGLSEYPELSSLFEKLLYQRNITMASKIEGFLKTGGTYFVVVGAGHLIGSKGILKLLERKGYTAQQL